jgi:hypothetical protein
MTIILVTECDFALRDVQQTIMEIATRGKVPAQANGVIIAVLLVGKSRQQEIPSLNTKMSFIVLEKRILLET